MARRTLSVSIWRIMRPRPAPRAARTAISFCRDAPRASIRLATFAHAISSTQPTAASRISKAGRAGPATRSFSGTTSTPRGALPAYCLFKRLTIVLISACASARDTRGLSRAMTSRKCAPRCSASESWPGADTK